MNTIQINNSDYWTLVNMLMNQITPDVRKLILDRLTEMNNQLIIGTSSQTLLSGNKINSVSEGNQLPIRSDAWQIQPDLARSSVMNSRKKDISEMQHPSLDFLNTKGQNPLPLQFNMNSYQMPVMDQTLYTSDRSTISTRQMTLPCQSRNLNTPGTREQALPKNKKQYNAQIDNEYTNEIDLDDIIEEIHNEPDELDEKLMRIKKLYAKIITDKRRRKKEREN